MSLDQSRAPILEGINSVQQESRVALGPPGHASGSGATRHITGLVGSKVFKSDAMTMRGIDDRRESKHVRQDAEALAAEAWGAGHCHFSSNGSSLSLHVALLAAASPGDTILVARNLHKSLLASVIFSRFNIVPLDPTHDASWDIDHGVPADELETKLAAHPEAKAVIIVSPTVYGVVADVRRLAEICHRHGKPLIVDEAWGAHFPFSSTMPEPAIRCGADLAVTSVHKTMAALSQASLVLMNDGLVAADRLRLAYDLFETTSPNVPIFASMDEARRDYALHGEMKIAAVVKQAERARKAIAKIDGIRVMGREVLDGDGAFGMDETKLFFDIGDLGLNGYEAEDWLLEEEKLGLSLGDHRRLLAVFVAGSGRRAEHRFISGMRALASWAAGDRKNRYGPLDDLPSHKELRGEVVMTPADAFFGDVEHILLEDAVGRIAAEMVSPYPPGIPRLIPGERITQKHVDFLRKSRDATAFFYDPSDMKLRTLRVVA